MKKPYKVNWPAGDNHFLAFKLAFIDEDCCSCPRSKIIDAMPLVSGFSFILVDPQGEEITHIEETTSDAYIDVNSAIIYMRIPYNITATRTGQECRFSLTLKMPDQYTTIIPSGIFNIIPNPQAVYPIPVTEGEA